MCALAIAAGCSNGKATKELGGSVRVDIVKVPDDVGCIRIDVAGTRSLRQDFDVQPGQAAVMMMTGVPVGDDIFYGSAFPGACAQVGPGQDPTWISDPVHGQVQNGRQIAVLINLYQQGSVKVGVNFVVDPSTGGPCVDASNPNCLNPADAEGSVNAPPPDAARMVGPADFAARLNDGSLILTSGRIEAAAAARFAARAEESRAIVEKMLANQPDVLAALEAEPVEDAGLRKAGDGNYVMKLQDSDRSVMTMGSFFKWNSVASAMRRYGTRSNQLAIYATYFEKLPAEYIAQRQLPTPEQLSKFEGPVIERLNLDLAADLGNIIKLLPPVQATAPSCDKEEGSPAVTTDEALPGCKPAGLFVSADFPLKPSATCVKDQGNRGSCVAFGLTGAVEAKIADTQGRWTNLSEERLYFWAKQPNTYGDGLDTAGVAAAMASTGFRYPFEAAWNYNPSRSRIDWKPVPAYTDSCVGYSGAHCSDTAHQGSMVCVDLIIFRFCGWDGSAPATAGFQVTSSAELMNYGANAGTALSVLALALHTPVVMSTAVTPSFDGAAANGIARFNGAGETSRGGHALAVLGYINNADLPDGTPQGSGGGYFIVKNSWGNCWKDGGYVYLPYDWVRTYAYSLVTLGVH